MAYTTITVEEYNRMAKTIQALRTAMQAVRELLEKGLVEKALEIVRSDAASEAGDAQVQTEGAD